MSKNHIEICGVLIFCDYLEVTQTPNLRSTRVSHVNTLVISVIDDFFVITFGLNCTIHFILNNIGRLQIVFLFFQHFGFCFLSENCLYQTSGNNMWSSFLASPLGFGRITYKAVNHSCNHCLCIVGGVGSSAFTFLSSVVIVASQKTRTNLNCLVPRH